MRHPVTRRRAKRASSGNDRRGPPRLLLRSPSTLPQLAASPASLSVLPWACPPPISAVPILRHPSTSRSSPRWVVPRWSAVPLPCRVRRQNCSRHLAVQIPMRRRSCSAPTTTKSTPTPRHSYSAPTTTKPHLSRLPLLSRSRHPRRNRSRRPMEQHPQPPFLRLHLRPPLRRPKTPACSPSSSRATSPRRSPSPHPHKNPNPSSLPPLSPPRSRSRSTHPLPSKRRPRHLSTLTSRPSSCCGSPPSKHLPRRPSRPHLLSRNTSRRPKRPPPPHRLAHLSRLPRRSHASRPRRCPPRPRPLGMTRMKACPPCRCLSSTGWIPSTGTPPPRASRPRNPSRHRNPSRPRKPSRHRRLLRCRPRRRCRYLSSPCRRHPLSPSRR